MTGLRFDNFSLQGNGVFTTDTDVYSAPARALAAEKLADADGAVIVKTSLEPKVFTCEGWLEAPTIAELDRLIDSFKRELNKQNQHFDLDYAGTIRRYVATPRNVVISRPKGLNTAGWSVEFYCANPVGADIEPRALLSGTAISTSAHIAPITVEGSYKAEPRIVVTISSVTGGTGGKTVSVSNDSTLRGLTVTRDWTNGDVLEIDCLNKTVYVNNAVVEFAGQFPAWEPGNSGISYLDDFTTRTVDLAATYTRRYL